MTADWPERLPGYDWLPAYWATRRAERGLVTPDLLPARPTGILIHSGDSSAGTAQWAWRPEARFWAHFAWDRRACCYVQTDSLTSWAPHGGAFNRWCWGIETPHYPGSGDAFRADTVELVRQLAARGAGWITGHRFIAHHKRDPGEVVTGDWWDGLGLRVYWEWAGEGGWSILEREGLG
jgi:hypothetical protein